MKITLVLLLSMVVLACSQREKQWQVLDFGSFRLRTPNDWVVVERQPIGRISSFRSFFGGLTNGTDSVWFDYGSYGVEITPDSGRWCRYAEDTVNGSQAVLSVPDSPGRGKVFMRIPLTGDGRFTIWASGVRDQATVLQIYKSAMFRSSDSSQNPPLRDVKYFDRTNINGKVLFAAECEACHPVTGIVDGPKIQHLLATRNAEWLFKFFTDRDFRAKDKLHQNMKSAYNNMDCIEKDSMTRAEAVALFYYIRSQP